MRQQLPRQSLPATLLLSGPLPKTKTLPAYQSASLWNASVYRTFVIPPKFQNCLDNLFLIISVRTTPLWLPLIFIICNSHKSATFSRKNKKSSHPWWMTAKNIGEFRKNVANGLANPQKNVAALRNVPGHRCFSLEYGDDRRTLVSSTYYFSGIRSFLFQVFSRMVSRMSFFVPRTEQPLSSKAANSVCTNFSFSSFEMSGIQKE